MGYYNMLFYSSPCMESSGIWIKDVNNMLNLFIEYLQIGKNYSKYTIGSMNMM